MIYTGDNLENLKKLEDNSVDSVVTDPPYGLSFMNRKWDYEVPSIEFWKEVYRVLKPGGHVLSFGGTRTYHRMVVNIEDAGFEIRDQIMWLYGSGFPKSHNISKAISKINGEDVKIGKAFVVSGNLDNNIQSNLLNGKEKDGDWKHKPTTKEAQEWEGWGTALKPANEPICVARKPLSEKSVAENVLKWGTGGINVDGCRVGSDIVEVKNTAKVGNNDMGNFSTNKDFKTITNEGRFPANLILECICDEVIQGEKGEVKKSGGSRDGLDITHEWGYGEINRTTFTDKGDIHTNPMCPCSLLDKQSGVSKSSKSKMGSAQSGNNEGRYNWNNGDKNDFTSERGHTDKGGASRYFFNVKNSGGTEYFFIYKENNIIIWNIKSLTTQEYNTEENIEASDALKQARESICQKPELYGNNTMVKYLMTTISITKMKTHSIMNLVISNASTKTNIGHFTLMIDEKQSQLLTEESILNVQIVSNQNALVSSIKTNQEVLVPIVSYVLEENLVSGETTIESTITNTTENIETSRFFYTAKVSKKERNLGLDGFEDKETNGSIGLHSVGGSPTKDNSRIQKNTHPTVKPVSLMTYLCRLITPQGGVVLDPFMGSGSTGIAARLEGFDFIGMEMDEEYVKIATARIENYEKYREFHNPNKGLVNGNTRMCSPGDSGIYQWNKSS